MKSCCDSKSSTRVPSVEIQAFSLHGSMITTLLALLWLFLYTGVLISIDKIHVTFRGLSFQATGLCLDAVE